MKQAIQKSPNLFYFLFTFGWTWLLVFGLILTNAVEDVSKPTPAFILVGLICGVSPSVSAFIITRVTRGKTGTAALWATIHKKLLLRYLLASILIVPMVNLLTTGASHLVIHGYTFTLTPPLLIIGLVWPLFSCFGEEFGWRGYLLPQLLQRHSPLKAGIILGLIWETWHLPMHYIGFKNYGAFIVPAFLVIGFINLTLQSVIMTQLYVRTKGCLKSMLLYHYTITGSSILLGAFFSTTASPRASVLEGMISVTLFFVVALFLTLRNRKANVIS